MKTQALSLFLFCLILSSACTSKKSSSSDAGDIKTDTSTKTDRTDHIDDKDVTQTQKNDDESKTYNDTDNIISKKTYSITSSTGTLDLLNNLLFSEIVLQSADIVGSSDIGGQALTGTSDCRTTEHNNGVWKVTFEKKENCTGYLGYFQFSGTLIVNRPKLTQKKYDVNTQDNLIAYGTTALVDSVKKSLSELVEGYTAGDNSYLDQYINGLATLTAKVIIENGDTIYVSLEERGEIRAHGNGKADVTWDKPDMSGQVKETQTDVVFKIVEETPLIWERPILVNCICPHDGVLTLLLTDALDNTTDKNVTFKSNCGETSISYTPNSCENVDIETLSCEELSKPENPTDDNGDDSDNQECSADSDCESMPYGLKHCKIPQNQTVGKCVQCLENSHCPADGSITKACSTTGFCKCSEEKHCEGSLATPEELSCVSQTCLPESQSSPNCKNDSTVCIAPNSQCNTEIFNDLYGVCVCADDNECITSLGEGYVCNGISCVKSEKDPSQQKPDVNAQCCVQLNDTNATQALFQTLCAPSSKL